MKKLIIKTGNQYIETTKKSKVSINNGSYIIEKEYMKSNKVVNGKITVNEVAFVEEVEFDTASEEA